MHTKRSRGLNAQRSKIKKIEFDDFLKEKDGEAARERDGTKPDVKRAIELYTLSAEQGIAKAQYNLGAMYYNGQGVEQSSTTAREWCAKAAAQGNEDAVHSVQVLFATFTFVQLASQPSLVSVLSLK